MTDKILDILNTICNSDDKIYWNTELIDSNILDSFAIIQLIFEFEKMGIEIQLTQISKEQIKYPYLIVKLVEYIEFNKKI